MDITDIISCREVPEAGRMAFVNRLFGSHFPPRLEPTVFNMAGRLAAQYRGGYWLFYELSNGGFYMGLRPEKVFAVSSQNGFEGQMSGDALGIVSCLFGYSNLSFGGDAFAEKAAQHFHWLRAYAIGHSEVSAILAASD